MSAYLKWKANMSVFTEKFDKKNNSGDTTLYTQKFTAVDDVVDFFLR